MRTDLSPPSWREVRHHLKMASEGAHVSDGLVDDRWEAVLLRVLARRSVAATDEFEARGILEVLTAEWLAEVASPATIGSLGDRARQVLKASPTPIVDAVAHVPRVPGLYAIHGHEAVWDELGISYRASAPLYVGKSESSLAGRDLQDHFAVNPSGRANTGGSTVRRSFAALLRDALQLKAVPRNMTRPERLANFGLEPEDDRRLTAWMHSNLLIAVWPAPDDMPSGTLGLVEVDVIRSWTPPLNIRDNPGRLAQLTSARRAMAAEAAVWADARN